MALDPRSRDEIYESLKSRLEGRISGLTNFATNTFNYIWTQAFSEALHKQEVAAAAIQLSGWVDYAGKELTQEDLNALGIGGIEPAEINQYMDSQHLDELGKEVGVSRNSGDFAEGELEITTTNDTVTIPSQTLFGTQPDARGNYIGFYTTEEATPETNENTVTVPIEANGVGEAYNVGSGTVTYMPNPPNGVESITNPSATSGGRGRESNEELRQSIKNAIFEQSGGGTEDGLRGYVETNVEGVQSVSIDEFEDADPIRVDVVVEGGLEESVLEAIEAARPVGIKHNLVRPTVFDVNIQAIVSGGSIDIEAVENAIVTYVSNRPLGGDIVRDKVIQTIMNVDADIERITTLNIEVSDEVHTYEDVDGNGSVDQEYTLENGSDMESDGIVEVTGVHNESSYSFERGVDFIEADTSDNGENDGIDWGVGGVSPDEGTEFSITYRVANDLGIESREKTSPASITVET